MSLEQVKALYHRRIQTGGKIKFMDVQSGDILVNNSDSKKYIVKRKEGSTGTNRKIIVTEVSGDGTEIEITSIMFDNYENETQKLREAAAAAPAAAAAAAAATPTATAPAPAPGSSIPTVPGIAPPSAPGDSLFNIWVEPISGKPLEYKPIKCDDGTFDENPDCENFIKKFVGADHKTKRDYISKIATDRVPEIRDIKGIDPRIALSFLASLGFKKKKQIKEDIHKIVYYVESYDEWKDRIEKEDGAKSVKRPTYLGNHNVTDFINGLIDILNNNLVFINKHLNHELIPNMNKIYDDTITVINATPKVPAEWVNKGLTQDRTNRWYESFITKVRKDWKDEKDKFDIEKDLETSVYGKKVNLINDEPREGILYVFNSVYPGYFGTGGGKSIEKEFGSKWSNIKNVLSQKNLKLMGNVDINEKLKEYGEINKQKDDLLKIMSDYGKFINSSKLNSSKDMSLLIGGYQELLNKEGETSEYLNKKLYVINELLNHVN